MSSSDAHSSLPPEEQMEISIFLGKDGKIYFHNITSEVIEIAHALDPSNEEIAQKFALLENLKKKGNRE